MMLSGKNVLLLCSVLTMPFFMSAGEERERKTGINNVFIVKTGPNQDVAALCDLIVNMLVGGNQGYFSIENKHVYRPDQKISSTAEMQKREHEIREQEAILARIYVKKSQPVSE